MIAYQEIPDLDNILDASNAFIIDQGIAVFALVVFALVIFGMMAIMLMIIRYLGKETNQQNKLITQHGLTLEQLRRNTEETAETKAEVTETKAEVTDLKSVFAEYIKTETENREQEQTSKQEAQATIEKGIETIVAQTKEIEAQTAKVEKNTESVASMNEQFQELEKAIREVLDKVEGGLSLDEKTKNEIIAEVSKNISSTVHDCMERAIKSTQETPIVEPEQKTVVAPVEPPKEAEEEKNVNKGNSGI